MTAASISAAARRICRWSLAIAAPFPRTRGPRGSRMLDGNCRGSTMRRPGRVGWPISQPEMTVVTKQRRDLYLFCCHARRPNWRCPAEFLDHLAGEGGAHVAEWGPHGSATPARRTLRQSWARQSWCAVEMRGGRGTAGRVPPPAPDWSGGASGQPRGSRRVRRPSAAPQATAASTDHPTLTVARRTWAGSPPPTPTPPLRRPTPAAQRAGRRGRGLARLPLENASFCAKDRTSRNAYRRRDLEPLLEGRCDALIAQGVAYLYFIDEIFLPHKGLLLDGSW